MLFPEEEEEEREEEGGGGGEEEEALCSSLFPSAPASPVPTSDPFFFPTSPDEEPENEPEEPRERRERAKAEKETTGSSSPSSSSSFSDDENDHFDLGLLVSSLDAALASALLSRALVLRSALSLWLQEEQRGKEAFEVRVRRRMMEEAVEE